MVFDEKVSNFSVSISKILFLHIANHYNFSSEFCLNSFFNPFLCIQV